MGGLTYTVRLLGAGILLSAFYCFMRGVSRRMRRLCTTVGVMLLTVLSVDEYLERVRLGNQTCPAGSPSFLAATMMFRIFDADTELYRLRDVEEWMEYMVCYSVATATTATCTAELIWRGARCVWAVNGGQDSASQVYPTFICTTSATTRPSASACSTTL